MSDAKPLTTKGVDALHVVTECEGESTLLVDRDRLLDTTRALEKAVAELDSARFARDRYANTIGLIESAIGFSGASPVEETIEHVRRLKAERDDGIASAEKAERELSAMASHSADGAVVAKMSRKSLERWAVQLHHEREEATGRAVDAERERDRLAVDAMTALITAGICTPERGYVSEPVCLTMDIGKLARERDAARATVAELVTALEGLFVEYDRLRSEGSKYAHMYCWVDRPPDHACAECMPDGGPMIEPGFRCREHAARAVLEKAKEATNG